MKKDNAGNPLPQYEIRIRGHIDSHWRPWFENLAIDFMEDGSTRLQGHVPDQAALFGILKKINNLGMTLLSVNSIWPD